MIISKNQKSGGGNLIDFGKLKIQTPAVCASVIGTDLDSMKDSLEKAIKAGADIVELRLDRLEKIRGWEELLKHNIPKIVTVRSKKEGGFFEGKEKERIEILIDAINRGVDCIDISLTTPQIEKKNVLKNAKKAGSSIILSFHDFEKTPTYEELKKKAEEMKKNGADFAKIIGFARSPEDSIDILKFLILARKEVEIPLIAFAMGEEGKFTRVSAPLLGSPLTYSSVGEKAAPGQMDVEEVIEILDKFRK